MRGATRPLRTARTTRVLVLALYYFALIAGLVLAHLDPDNQSTPFVYQAF